MKPKNHKKYIFIFLSIAFLVTGSFLLFASRTDSRKVTDDDFILIDEKISNNEKLKLITYKYDIGTLGYSRVFWAVVPHEYGDLNLSLFELPDGYKGVGWTNKNELIIEKWEPYYKVERAFELNDSDFYNGVRIKIK
jgi:hypothetical protein